MPKLIHQKNNRLIASQVILAKGFSQRVRGLIGSLPLKEGEAFWLPSCPSIHTFFMKFPIDVIFTDRKFYVSSLFENVSPWRILFGGFKSWNVFEMKAGQIKAHDIHKGDQLNVES